LCLHEDFRVGHDAFCFDNHALGIRGDHDRRRGRRGFAHGIESVGEQRAAGDGVQHLRPRGTHARALAGREHDGKAAALIDQSGSPKRVFVPSYPSAARWKRSDAQGLTDTI